jgi:hypothetical protein
MSHGDCHEENRLERLELEVEEIERIESELLQIIRELADDVNKMVTLPRWLNELADRENVNCSQIFQNALKAYLEVENRQ